MIVHHHAKERMRIWRNWKYQINAMPSRYRIVIKNINGVIFSQLETKVGEGLFSFWYQLEQMEFNVCDLSSKIRRGK